MKNRKILLGALALILFLTMILPAIIHRISFEQESKVYVASIDATRLEKFFKKDQMVDAMLQYKESGITTALIHEKQGKYNEDTIRSAKEAGLNIALAPDVTFASDAELERLVREYGVKYIKLEKGIWGRSYDSYDKSAPVCRILDRYDLTLVISENIMQLGNEEPRHFDRYIEAADGKIIRAYTSYYATNIDQKEYPAVYYQMYNSAYDRNTRFIMVKQLMDGGFTHAQNAERTQENIRLFCAKMESHGFVSEGEINYNHYTPNLRLTDAATAAITVLMIAFLAELLISKKIPYLLPIAVVVAGCAFGATYLLPESLLELYPTAFGSIAPCFNVGCFLAFIRYAKKRMNFFPLLLAGAGLSLALIFLSGAMMTALLGSPEYYLNMSEFRGVKATLILPLAFAGLVLLCWAYKKRTLAEYKEFILSLFKKVRWYHFLLLGIAGIIGFIYITRSGNVDRISFTETYTRNLLTEIFAARPRTKDFLLAWPFLSLYIYYAKANRSKLLQWGFGIGSALLFSSAINTFCHTFTLSDTMFLRIGTGLLFGVVFSALYLTVNHFLLKGYDRFIAKKI